MKTKTTKRVLSVVLTVVMLLSAVPLGGFIANAAGGVAMKMDAFFATVKDKDKGNYQYYRNGVCYAGQCHGFACDLWYNVFGYDMYQGKSYETSKQTTFTESAIKSFIKSNARIGDIIRTPEGPKDSNGNYINWVHSYVIREITDSGIRFYEYGGDKAYSKGAHEVTLSYKTLADRWGEGQFYGKKAKSYFLYKINDSIYTKVDGTAVTVNFNGNGGTPSSSSEVFAEGNIYGDKMPSATRTGYTFDGWYTSASSGTRIIRSTNVTAGNKTLYAHWIKNETGILQLGHIYRIYNENSGLVIVNDGDDNKSKVVQKNKGSSGNSELWRVLNSDENGYYRLESLNSGGKVLDVDGNYRWDYGTAVQIYQQNNNDSQRFSIIRRNDKTGYSGLYSIHSKNSGRAIDVEEASTEVGAELHQWDYHDANNQLFYFEEVTSRNVTFYDNHNNNYIASPAEVYEIIQSTTSTSHYSSRNKEYVTVSLNPENDSITIKALKSGSPGKDLKFVTLINGSYNYDFYEYNDTTMVLKFRAKSNVAGVKMCFRWGYDSEYKSIDLTTEWKNYSVELPRSKNSGDNIHPYIDKACTVEMADIALYEKETEGYIGDTDAYTSQTIEADIYNEFSCDTPIPTRNKDGYVFDGWYTRRVGGEKVADIYDYYDVSALNGDQMLYAHWTEDLTPHVHYYNQIIKEPTCTKEGYTSYVCSDCGYTYIDNYVNALGHAFGTWKTIKSATCTAEGVQTRTCSRCSTSETKAIAKTAHTVETDPAVAATCTAAGKTQGSHCSVCSAVITAQQTVNALGHAYGSWTTTKAATCTAEGVQTRTCSRCNNSETKAIAKTAHSAVTDPAVAATCTATGKTQGSHCSVCSAVITAQQTVNALGHAYGSWTTTKAATCTAEGVQTRTCSRCNNSETKAIAKTAHTAITDPAVAATCTAAGKTQGSHCSVCSAVITAQQTVNALGHAYGSWTTTQAATCTAEGVQTRTCSRCSTSETKAIAKTAHTVVTDPAVAATCTAAGKTQGSHCSVCSAVITAQQTVNALGHSYGSWTTTKAATCTAEGVQTRTCTRCNNSETKAIAKTAHTPKTVTGYPATCSMNGLTNGTVCSACSTVITAQQTIAATGNHADNDHNGKCDSCSKVLDPTVGCSCNCHKGGFQGFIFKIILFFQKIFKTNKVCQCGVNHY